MSGLKPVVITDLEAKHIWYHVSNALPQDGVFVMVVCKSNYLGIDKVICLAKLDREYRPWKEGENPRWIDEGNDSLNDRSYTPVYWRLYNDEEFPPIS